MNATKKAGKIARFLLLVANFQRCYYGAAAISRLSGGLQNENH